MSKPILLTLLAFAVSPAMAAPVDPAPVVAAERAFAADGLALGVRDAFLKHSAPEAIVFGPGVQKVHETFPKQDADKGGPPLVWWPLWAAIARSGDLGFTTGPYSYDGQLRGYYSPSGRSRRMAAGSGSMTAARPPARSARPRRARGPPISRSRPQRASIRNRPSPTSARPRRLWPPPPSSTWWPPTSPS